MPERPGRRHRCRVLLLAQELLPAPGISSDGGWAWFLLGLGLVVRGQYPCVKGEGEVGARCEGELDCQALAGQCLAEVQALGCQVGFIHCSHF